MFSSKSQPAAGPGASNDILKLSTNKKALKALSSNSAGNDKVLWSAVVVKINRKGKSQNRVLLITTRHVLNLMPDNYSKCNRCFGIAQLHHVSVASSAQEFVLHVTDEYDYRFKTPHWQGALDMLKHAYTLCRSEELGVADMDVNSLTKQVATKVSVKQDGAVWTSQNRKASLNPLVSGKVMDDDDSDDEGGVAERSLEPVGESASGPTVGGAFQGNKFTADDFEVLKVLGKGAFGKVMLVRQKEGGGMIYAMKVLSKQLLMERNEVVHTKTERRALEDTHHPFLVHLRFAFQTASKLYLVMDYCNGGELFYHLKTSGKFSENRTRLYGAEITSALEHLHSRKIVYRDLKPENVLLDAEGHVRVTDFGLAKDEMDMRDKTHTFCGTPDYLAPEIIKGSGHGRGVDWWSLGTMIYEMLGGLPPYYSENVNLMYERVLRAPLEFKPPDAFTPAAQDLLKGLLEKEPEKRMGSSEKDALELRGHAWFAPIDWGLLMQRKLTPEFKPAVASEVDTSNFDEEFTSQSIREPESVMPDSMLSQPKGAQNAFEGFTYVDRSALGQ